MFKSIEDYEKIAQEAYPQEDPNTALRKYVVENWIDGVKFTDGVRYVIAHDYDNFRRKDSCIHKFKVITDSERQLFLNELQRPIHLQEVGRTTEAMKSIRKVYKNQSEDQWNVPRDHKTHFLKFPREIQDNIFGHALLPFDGCLICPRLVTSNWEENYTEPYHTIRATIPGLELVYDGDSSRLEMPWNLAYFDNSLLSFIRRTLDDKQGPYIELLRILRPQADATLLRTCKAFYEIGSKLLYGTNTLTFDMVLETTFGSPPSWIGEKTYRPDPSKDDIAEDSTSKAIQQLRSKATITEIPGWCYYDPFIRFLYHVRPRNSALVRKLRFKGTIRMHQCTIDLCRHECKHDLIQSMKCYIPFINEFCTGLQELILEVQFDEYEGHDGISSDKYQEVFDRIFKKFLENEIRELKTVRVLTLVAATEKLKQVDIHIAEETILWFHHRAADWARE